MTKNNSLSSADLLTLQVLERELIDPNISKDYERELRKRIEYLSNPRPTENEMMTYTYRDMVSNKVLLVVNARYTAEADEMYEKTFGHNPWTRADINMITE